MNTGHIYAVTALVCLLINIVIIKQVTETKYAEIIDVAYNRMVIFFLIFFVADILWGFCYSKPSFINWQIFTIVAYFYHSMAALSAFMWVGYMKHYVSASIFEIKALNVFRGFLFFIQFILLLLNLWTHDGFKVSENLDYSMGRLRLVLYCLQFSYFIIFSLFSIFKYLLTKEKVFADTLYFSLILLIFGISQYLFYDVPMYSLGFMFLSITIYSFNITSQREIFFSQLVEEEKLRAETDALTGILNRRAYEDDIHTFDQRPLPENFIYLSFDINGLKLVNDSFGHLAGDELIQGAAKCIEEAFGRYGKVYRIGGDEFSAMISTPSDQFIKILFNFNDLVDRWSGNSIKKLSVSFGYASRNDFKDYSALLLSKEADKRMYISKNDFYKK